MRKSRWLIVGFIVFLAMGGGLFIGRPSREIDELKPYVVSEQISFMRPDKHVVRPGKALPAALENHTYFLHNISEQQLIALLNRSVASRRQADGWFIQRDPFPELYEPGWMYNATARHGYGFLNGYKGLREGPVEMPKEQVVFTVIDTVPISSIELLRYRLLHRGDPKW